MSKPYIHFPDANPQTGEQHKTVAIRQGNGTIRLKCKSREDANALGIAIINAINAHMSSRNKINIHHEAAAYGVYEAS